MAAIRALCAYELYAQAVVDKICLPIGEPDPEDVTLYSKREWEGAVQVWRARVEECHDGFPKLVHVRTHVVHFTCLHVCPSPYFATCIYDM